MKLAIKPNLTRGGNSRRRGFFALRGLLAPSIDCMVDQRNFRRAVAKGSAWAGKGGKTLNEKRNA
jgi:hypothetical protein